MLTVLRRGVETVRQAVETSPREGVGYDRLDRLVDASRRITWTYEEKGSIFAAEDTVATDVQVTVLGEGSPPGLDETSTFQAQEDDDGYTRIYVRRRSFTPTWAGIVLFHELDHVLDHLDGVWPSDATPEDWWAAEARAYHRELLVVDAVTSGRLLPAVDALVSTKGLDQLLERQPEDLAGELYREAFPASRRQPPASEPERWVRSAALAMGLVVAASAYPAQPPEVPASNAAADLRRAAATWGWGPEGVSPSPR